MILYLLTKICILSLLPMFSLSEDSTEAFYRFQNIFMRNSDMRRNYLESSKVWSALSEKFFGFVNYNLSVSRVDPIFNGPEDLGFWETINTMLETSQKKKKKIALHIGDSYKIDLKSVKNLYRIFWALEYWFKVQNAKLVNQTKLFFLEKRDKPWYLAKSFSLYWIFL